MRSTVLSVVALTLCSGQALASPQQDGPPPPGGPMPAMQQVFISPFGEVFTAPADSPYPVSNWFEGADADADGQLTYDEFAKDGLRWFAVLDEDQDGRLSFAELTAYENNRTKAMSPAGGPQGGPPNGGQGGPRGEPAGGRNGPPPGGPGAGGPGAGAGGPGGGGPRGGNPGGRMSMSAMANLLGVQEAVKTADTNTNQTVTAEEWDAVTRRWFTLLDTDRDGKLALDTLPKTQLQQAQQQRTQSNRR